MSTAVQEDLILRFAEIEAPEIEAREQRIVELLLEARPRLRARLFEKAQLTTARTSLCRVLERRRLTPSPEEAQRIEACTDLPTLERWHDQAVTAASVADALL